MTDKANKIIDIWIIKNALTDGIYKTKGELQYDGSYACASKGWVVELDKFGRFYAERRKNEWAATEKEAFKKAETMRVKKIKSLEKRIQKLKDLKIGSNNDG